MENGVFVGDDSMVYLLIGVLFVMMAPSTVRQFLGLCFPQSYPGSEPTTKILGGAGATPN